MKRITLISLLLVILALAACGPASTTPSAPAVENSDPPARPTPTNLPDTGGNEMPAGYPPPPTTPPLPEGYPAPVVAPTYDPYPAPGDTVWMLHPVGIQCQDAAKSKYQNEQEAISALTAAGITVQQMTTTELMVCSACDCPTSAHYRAEINAADMNKATALGWTLE